MKINEVYFVKKILFMIPLFLFTSCVETNLSSSTSSFERRKYTLNVYQVYEEEHGSNIWSNPRFDALFEFYNDEKIIKNENNIEKKENSAKNPQTKDNKQAQNPNQNINKNNIQSAPVFV